MKKLLIAALAVALFGAGLFFGAHFMTGGGSSASVAAAGGRQPLFYRHPMTPSITSPVPAKDDMGMDYIPVYADEAGESDGALVKISPVMVNNLGVRTAPVTRGDIAREINTVGYVDYDEQRLSHVHLRVEGWIEDLQVRTLGARVKAGDLLFKVYSPDLVNAQSEYLQGLTGGGAMRAAGRERLKALGLNERQIEELEKTRKPQTLTSIFARQDGIVAELDVREGMFVTPGTQVMTLADISSVWVLVDVFENQADWVQVGQQAKVRLPHLSGQAREGQVEYIYPQLDPKTRTLKARLRFDNRDEALRPNMYADVTVHADPKTDTLSIPSEAVIRTGGSRRVIVSRGEGQFDPVEVKTGVASGDQVQILEGLKEGDQVVVSAQFLLDSEASLKAGLRRMTNPEAHAKPLIWSEGKVNGVQTSPPTLNLSHAPIPELNWPQMTMDFPVVESVDLAAVKPGQTLRFGFRETEAGYQIQEIEPAQGAAQPKQPKVQAIEGQGTLNEIDPSEHTVNISHGPMPALSWPAMTMDFTVAQEIDLAGFKPGQKVRFGLVRTDSGFVITELSPAE
jgi:Cu(I)/Ag(I) efflux system membrane fusion protein